MSNETNETIADIIKEKRSEAQYIRENNDTKIGRMVALKLEEEAGRIEAAWKREREAALSAPPRNCDRPECATTKAAQDVWRKEDGGKTAYYEWLLATSTKGDAK